MSLRYYLIFMSTTFVLRNIDDKDIPECSIEIRIEIEAYLIGF